MAEHESVRSRALQTYPDFPWLDADDLGSVTAFLEERSWLRGQEVLACKRAGDGNMNLTLRLECRGQSFIMKQSRPWVEKYDTIEAPWDRALFEARFYERASGIEGIAGALPRVLESDPRARVLLMEDIPDAKDCTSLYSGDRLDSHEIRALASFLRELHRATRGSPEPALANPEMRALNHAHIFLVPMDPGNGVDLESLAPGLLDSADSLRRDVRYREALAESADHYLRDGPVLLHGDYFPGSWLRTNQEIKIIDPEFCFYGGPEIDVGCALAHLALAGQPATTGEILLDHYLGGAGAGIDPGTLARFAAAEVMRRLIGVAQLPIPGTPPDSGRQNFRTRLLERSRVTMRSGRVWDLLD